MCCDSCTSNSSQNRKKNPTGCSTCTLYGSGRTSCMLMQTKNKGRA